jgi:hypothetical protein
MEFGPEEESGFFIHTGFFCGICRFGWCCSKDPKKEVLEEGAPVLLEQEIADSALWRICRKFCFILDSAALAVAVVQAEGAATAAAAGGRREEAVDEAPLQAISSSSSSSSAGEDLQAFSALAASASL